MNKYELSKIWQRTLAPKLGEDIHKKERELLRIEYENIRERAALVAGEIARDLPDFSVHDIAHIDSLWNLADLIIDDEFDLTPSEAFVLGCSFLIHDLGMGLAAYPEGVESLSESPFWADTVAFLYQKKYSRNATPDELQNLEPEIKRQSIEIVLRRLHAKHAEKLTFSKWKKQNTIDEFYYLIDNNDLRESYGKIIGLIAHSHWWDTDEVLTKLSVILGAPGFLPQEWEVDPIKVACLLRIADASNVDDRRAPGFLRAIRKINGYSDLHWNFQQKLYQPRLEKERLVYTSKTPFLMSDAESWWLCYEVLKMLDTELRDVDSLLSETNRKRLKAIGVANIEDPIRFSKLVTTDNWKPVDAQVKVGNVAKLVQSLGGSELYGKNYIVPLRELIQNSADAIRARRFLEGEGSDFGKIVVRKGNDDDGDFIEVEDNGVGMSLRVLTGPFLDFGQSFWGTSLMHEELPFLQSKGFVSTGKYGIGFFSCFMWGRKVSVFTRRYENSRGSTKCLQFNNGVFSRPLLRDVSVEEQIKDGGTRIRVWIDSDIMAKINLKGYRFNRTYEHSEYELSFKETCERLCCALDTNLYVKEYHAYEERLIQANDWKELDGTGIIKRLIGKAAFKLISKEQLDSLNDMYNSIEDIRNEFNDIIGRGFVYDYSSEDLIGEHFALSGIITIGGMESNSMEHIIGIFKGESVRASRDIALPLASNENLRKWAESQAQKISLSNILSTKSKYNLAKIIRRCGGHTYSLPICYYKDKYINYGEVVGIARSMHTDINLVYEYVLDRIYIHKDAERIDFKNNVFFVDMSVSSFLDSGSRINIEWPEIDHEQKDWYYSVTLNGLVIEAIAEAWDVDLDKLIKRSVFSEPYSYEDDTDGARIQVGETKDGKAFLINDVDVIKYE